MIVSGTGSRSLATLSYNSQMEVLQSITSHLYNLRPTLVISGGAEGFDACLAFAAFNLNIPYHLYLPNGTYGTYYWKDNSVTGKDRWTAFETMHKGAADIRLICKTVYVNGIHSNFIRNEAMVKDAEHFLVWEPTSRGTAHCLNLIKKANKPFSILPRPSDLP